MLSSILNWFTHREERTALNILIQNQSILTNNIIALSRLMLVHPDTLKRESDNTTKNTEFMQSYAQ